MDKDFINSMFGIHGLNMYADSTLSNMTKKELINHLRICEANLANQIYHNVLKQIVINQFDLDTVCKAFKEAHRDLSKRGLCPREETDND